jgi:hypothetical protein
VLSPAIGVARSKLEGRAMAMGATPLPGFKLIDPRKQTRRQRRANERAYRADCDFFRLHPLRLTRVRPALDGEPEHTLPGKRCFVVVRQIRLGTHHKIFGFSNSELPAAFASESAAAEVYNLMLEDWQRDEVAKWKQQALGELLAIAPVRGNA